MTSESPQPVSAPARRTIVAAAGVTGLAAALTACGGSNDTSSSSSSGAQDNSSASTTTGGGGGAAAGSGGTALAKTSDIPKGGGKVFADQGVVVTQPSAGTFKAFSAQCTHAGCTVKGVSNGVISCPCHGSQFSAADGSVKNGPATEPLPATKITVSGGEIKLA